MEKMTILEWIGLIIVIVIIIKYLSGENVFSPPPEQEKSTIQQPQYDHD